MVRVTPPRLKPYFWPKFFIKVKIRTIELYHVNSKMRSATFNMLKKVCEIQPKRGRVSPDKKVIMLNEL